MSRILIFGKGFMGTRIQQFLGCDVVDVRIASLSDAQGQVARYNPDIIINCIGHIGRNVDDCEFDQEKTLTANSFVPLWLAEVAIRNGIKLVHMSTGCIYHYDYVKNVPIDDAQVPDFFDLFYSRSKIYSERALEVLCGQYPILIVRIRVPLDDRPDPRNLLDKLIQYKKVIDLPNSVTYIPDFLRALKFLIDRNARGIFNTVSTGGLVYADLMNVYRKYCPDFNYTVVPFKDLNMVRTNLVMSDRKLEESGFRMRNINEVLEECVSRYLKY